MSDTPYNWVREHKPEHFTWDGAAGLTDCEEASVEIGDSVQLLRDSVAFDERGVAQGIWTKGLIVPIVAASSKLKVVMFEGVIGSGWASGVLPVENLRLYVGKEIPDAPNS